MTTQQHIRIELFKVSNRGRASYHDEQGNIYLDCLKCDVPLPENMFHANKGCFLGRNGRCKRCIEEYTQANKEKILECRRKYREANREKERERSRRYYEANKEKILERDRKYYEANKEKKLEYTRKYAMNNPQIRGATRQRRRARKRALPDTLTAEQANLLGTTCVLTGQENVHLDHVIPLSVGHGGTTYENMIPLSAGLNLSKHASNVFEWAEQNHERFGFTMDRFNEVMAEVASRNDMTLDEYRQYVYWCFEYPREVCPENEILCK